jgi:hypothetical protein
MGNHKPALAAELTPDEAFSELEEQYGRPLDAGQRLEIGNNLAGFFAILNEWDLKQKTTTNVIFQDVSDLTLEKVEQKNICLVSLPVKKKPRRRKPQGRAKKASLPTFSKHEDPQNDEQA